jgi:hypothetical protein
MALPGFVMRFAAYLAVACVAGMSSEAAPPPDDFRQQMVDAAEACTAAYSKLASGRDSSRSDDDEMRDAARGQARLARELLKEWSHLDDDEVEEALRDVSLEIETQDFDDDQLLDFTIYCDDQLADLVETADSRGYTP